MPRYTLSFYNSPSDAEPTRQVSIDAADRDLATDIANGQRRPDEERVDVAEEDQT